MPHYRGWDYLTNEWDHPNLPPLVLEQKRKYRGTTIWVSTVRQHRENLEEKQKCGSLGSEPYWMPSWFCMLTQPFYMFYKTMILSPMWLMDRLELLSVTGGIFICLEKNELLLILVLCTFPPIEWLIFIVVSLTFLQWGSVLLWIQNTLKSGFSY